MNQRDSILEIIPMDASLIIKSNNFPELFKAIQNNDFWKELYHLNELNELTNNIQYFDSLLSRNTTIYNFLNHEAYISFHLIGLNKIKPVFYFPLIKINDHNLKNQIGSLLEGYGSMTYRTYENATIYDAIIQKSQQKFSFAFINGNLVISPSSILVENSIRQFHAGDNLLKTYGFNKVMETSGNSSVANIYINYKTIPNILKVAFNNTYASKIKSRNNIAEWSELDLTLKNQLLLLNGFTYNSDSLNSIENILKGQSPRKFSLHTIFPASSYSFFSIILSDPLLFKQKYRQYLQKGGILSPYESKILQYKKEFNTDIEELIYNMIDSEMGKVFYTTNPEADQPESFFIIHTKGNHTTHEAMMKVVNQWGQNEKKNIGDYMYNYFIDEGASYNIYKFPVHTLINDLFGVFYNFDEACYFTLIDNYLIFSGKQESLSKFIYENVLNKTLEKSIEYNDFTEYINSRSNLFYYMKIPKSKEIVLKYFNKSLLTIYNENPSVFEKINTLAYQISGTDEMLYNNITINYLSNPYEHPLTEWETLLDTSINFKPVLVKNHYTKENEIFVQDLNHNIYLINNSGRITWKQNLDETINSEVYQVDYYNNGKLQLMFSTKKALHLIDRNGNYVERYPVKLRANATAGMSLFDYDKNKNYRIFIPCDNKKIYAYSLEGNIITGFQFQQTDHLVLNPVQHFRIQEKDYIVLADQSKIYILDRQGNTRVKPEKQISKSINNPFYLDNNGNINRLVTTDTSGNLCYFYFNGKVEMFHIDDFNSDHFFELADMNADGINDFIYMANNNLCVYNHNHQKILTYTFSNDLTIKPIYFHFASNDRKLGLVNNEKEEIYLINNDGKLYKGFPLIGNSLFSIGILENNNSRFNLIVGGKNNYLYNYSVN